MEVLETTVEFIGPSSQKFLERQTIYHMNGLRLDQLEPSHLPELSRWVKVSGSLLIGRERAEELAGRILLCGHADH